VHAYTGDERILTSHYDAFTRYVDYLTSRAPDGIVTFGLNDWVPYETQTPGDITSTAYYYVDLLITAQTAALLGKNDDAEKYTELAERVKAAFNAKFFDPKMNSYGSGSQTSLSCALYQGLVEPQHRAAVVQKLVEAVEKRDNHIDTGILGAKYVLLALLENGRADVAYRIVNQKTLPGWGHWINSGATTLWEDWKGKESLNHIMFGDVSAWFYKAIAGIVPDPEQPAFKHFTIKPHLLGELTHARVSYDSVRGRIESAWKLDGDTITLNVTVPANTRATVYVPTRGAERVMEGGKPIPAARADAGYAVFEIGSGEYTFTAPH
jgi:alpha-L-rhamnosidase